MEQEHPAQSRESAAFEVELKAFNILRALLTTIAALTIAGTISAYIYFTYEPVFSTLFLLFMLDVEANLPTFFSFTLLLFCAVLLIVILAQQRHLRAGWLPHWSFLAMSFFIMAFDEAAQLHERLIIPIRDRLDASHLFYFAWVIPAWAFVFIFSFAYLRFLLSLPKPFAGLFFLAAMLYVAGALVIEMVGGAYAEIHGIKTLRFHLIATLEEALEMTGLAVFAYALMRFLAHRQKVFCVGLRIS